MFLFQRFANEMQIFLREEITRCCGECCFWFFWLLFETFYSICFIQFYTAKSSCNFFLVFCIVERNHCCLIFFIELNEFSYLEREHVVSCNHEKIVKYPLCTDDVVNIPNRA